MTADKNALWSFDRIVAYFEDRLSTGEVEEIDAYIEQNEEFAHWVDDIYAGWLRDPESFIIKTDALQRQLLEQLQSTGQRETASNNKEPANNKSKARLRRLIIYTSGAIAAIFCIALVFWSSFFNACTLQDAACIAQQGEGLHKERFTEMNADANLTEQISAIARAYSKGEYQTVIDLSNTIPAATLSGTQMNELTLLQGIARLQLGNADDALALLGQLTDSTDPYYRINALWYAALSYLQKEDYKNARPLLEEIVAFDGQHSQLARQLLNQLRWASLFRR